MKSEETLVIIKPDALSKRVAGKVIDAFETAGLRIMGARMVRLSRERAGEFYAEHRGKGFYEQLVEFMTSNPVIVMVLGGENAVRRAREVIGKTNPAEAADGTIRKEYAESVRYNAVHGSDSESSAQREVGFFFPDRSEIFHWDIREYIT